MKNYSHLQAVADDYNFPGHARILISGKSFVADVNGALFWPSEETLIFSDLHLKKDVVLADSEAVTDIPSFQSRETRATLMRLSHIIAEYNAKQVIVLGNGLHEAANTESPLSEDDAARLRAMQGLCKWVWVMEDNDTPELLKSFNVDIKDQYPFSGLTFRHKPLKAPVSHEIAGALHPVAKTVREDEAIYQRCFVSNNSRLVMPSFALEEPGTNVLDKSFSPLFSSGSLYVWLISMSGVSSCASRLLEAD